MLVHLNYERLKKITQTEKPYRGSTNRFPIGDRRHNTKFFLVDEDSSGREIFRIIYGYMYNAEDITKEEYDIAKAAGDKNVSEYSWTDPSQYKRHIKMPHQLGIVHSDNTFEFVNSNNYYGQGSNILMSRWSHGYFYSSSRHGGMVYRERGNATRNGNGTLFHPIFAGMRVHIGTGEMHESSNYSVVGHRVSRKNSKKFLERYSKFYKVAESMMKAMDSTTYFKVSDEVIQECLGKGAADIGYWIEEKDLKAMRIKADDLVMTAPLDAAILYGIGLRLYRGDLWRCTQRTAKGESIWRTIETADIFNNLKRGLNKYLFETNPECMKTVEFPEGEQYPQSDWGYEVYVTNNKTGVKYRAKQYS